MARPWYKRQEIPDPQVRDAADHFESARQLLWAQPPGSGLLYPLLNAAAVAIELYLKCLSAEKVYHAGEGWGNICAKPSMRGHVLTTLFDNIDCDLQQELDSTYGSQLSAFGGLSFRDVLSQCEGALHESCYPFEPASDPAKYPLGLLMACSHSLHQFVAKLKTKDRIRY